MRTALVATTCALALTAGVGLSACGSGDDPTDKIPTTAPALLPPDDANDLVSGTAGKTGTTPSTTTTTPADTGAATGGTTDTGAEPDTGGADTGAAPDTGGTGNGGGAAPNPGGTGNGGGAAPNPGGVTPDAQAGAGSFQGFCDANPGAC